MSQIQMIQAGVQVEAAQELGKLIRPLIHKIVRGVRSLRSTDNTPAATQPIFVAQGTVEGLAEHIQVQEG